MTTNAEGFDRDKDAIKDLEIMNREILATIATLIELRDAIIQTRCTCSSFVIQYEGACCCGAHVRKAALQKALQDRIAALCIDSQKRRLRDEIPLRHRPS